MTETREIKKKEAELEKGVERTRARRVFTPSVDIIEKENDILLVADMPGVDEKSVDITIEKDQLTICGTVETEIPENHRLALSEYGVGDYDGVLRLTLPKAEVAKTKKIPVTGNA
jgi:HSP20 family molecular chaperone IbpA